MTTACLHCAGHRLTTAVAVAVFGCGSVSGQVRVVIEGGVVIEAGEIGAEARVEPGPPAVGGDEFTIGDPWWDAVDATRPAVAAEAGQPGDAQDRARQQAQARLVVVRRNRGTQILRRELSRIRAACPSLEPAARAAIMAAGREAVEGQAAGQAPLVGGVETALTGALVDHAGPEAAAAYRAELEARADRRRAAALAVLMEAIERDAVLDAEGRRTLAAALAREWRPEWEAFVATAARRQIGAATLPAGVADVVAATLDAEAFTAWRNRAGEAP